MEILKGLRWQSPQALHIRDPLHISLGGLLGGAYDPVFQESGVIGVDSQAAQK